MLKKHLTYNQSMNARKTVEPELFCRAHREWTDLIREPTTPAELLGFSARFGRCARDTIERERQEARSLGEKNLPRIYSNAVYFDTKGENIAIRLAKRLHAAKYAKYHMPLMEKEAIISAYENTKHPEAYAEWASVVIHRIKARGVWKELFFTCTTISCVAKNAPDMMFMTLREFDSAILSPQPNSILYFSRKICREALAFANGKGHT